ncbi:macrophage mannose receptor 1-like [Hemibagrus wyckioides]|uniref:macrophage mannose receptor 1-like n=1 Tax=Hemibagrus wyckioides TaxID=337641 RepID=UPI00266D9F6D|nr:macrophage mannose receptor 1-like [Hemibagrus wyckioides]
MFQLLLLLGFFSLGVCLPRQYHFINENKTWSEAQRYCRENYVDLASINNTEEELAVTDIIDIWNSNRTWIGLYDDLNSWKWSLDNESFYKGGERSFRNWYIQKPRNWNGNALCVYVSYYSAVWSETSCSGMHKFICFDGRLNASERYVPIYENMNWTEAQRYCREHYTDLTSVRNETENQKIRSVFKNSYYSVFWIGLYRTRSWSDKSNSSFSNWKPGQPDNYRQNESCTAVSFKDSGKWTDENCSQAFPFLCYRTMPSSPSRQYHFVNENKTWTEAQRYCRENYTDLATIDNMEEMNKLLNTVNGSYTGLAWIGLYDDENSWRWSLDDDAFYQEGERDFRGWEHQPDNSIGNEMCVYIRSDGTWSDGNCNSNLPFVCYDGWNGTENYTFIIQFMSWTQAQNYCRVYHTDLASVRNQADNVQIRNLTSGFNAWIGLYRTRLWSDKQESMYENWRPATPSVPEQPDNGANVHWEFGFQHCTAVSLTDSGYWTDESCLTTIPFFCYKKSCTASSCSLYQHHFINENKTWTEAQRYCRDKYTDLATVNNMEDVKSLLNTVYGIYSGSAWIGLYDDLKSWTWSLDDASFYKNGERDFRNWYLHKPRNWNGKSLCVYFSGYSANWWEESCSLKFPFICFDGRVNASESYVLIKQYMNWTEAQSYCREHYTDLASVRNETENHKIRLLSYQYNYHYYYYSIWIGLYRTRSWSDQSNSSFSNWKPGQPDNYAQNESCTAVSFIDSGKWTDENCCKGFPFLCYSTMPSLPSHQYHFVNENKTWTEAQRYCRENYTDLATIDNMEEMNTLINTVNGSYSGLAWIGLYDDLDSWRWSLGDDAFYQEGERDFRGWEHQPDNSNGQEFCVSMNTRGEWFDRPCDYRYKFVCYNGTNTYVENIYSMTWEEAQRYCRENYLDLASVRNENELQQIMRLSIPSVYEVWIGLHRNRLWSDQSSTTFTYWRPAFPAQGPEPDNGVNSFGEYLNQHCTAVDHSGRWTDENCLDRLPFICYSGFLSLGVCLPRQYHFINESKTWAEAQRYCRENYVDLVSVNNIDEQQALNKIVKIWNSRQTWIGLYDDLKSWKWSLDDASFYKNGDRNFRNWYINKPRNWNGNNLCVYIFSYSTEWVVASCSHTLPFICFDGRVNASERYVLVNKNMNWTEAQRYCREHYTDLTSVRNETENQQIGVLLPNNVVFYYGAVWIGLYRTRSWSDKSNSSFSNWKPGQPDNYRQNESCTAVSFNDSGKWTDENCGQAFPFLCYSTMSAASSHQYHFVNENKTWTEAQRYCRENYTDLATIDNMEEMNTLLNTVNGSYSGLAWIGLYDDEDSWRWSLDDDAFYQEGERDFRGWEHQPDNSNGQELCVSMNPKGEWFDRPCNYRMAFVCYNGTTNTYVGIFNLAMTWDEAQKYCRANHRDLASVRNETELQQLLNLTRCYDVWIGLHRNRLWSDQSNLSFTYWLQVPEAPRDNSEIEYSIKQHQNQHCTSVAGYRRWKDENCFARLPFICYTEFTPGAVMGLQLKINAIGNPSYSDIEGWVLIKLGQELSRLGLSRNITLNVRNISNLKLKEFEGEGSCYPACE